MKRHAVDVFVCPACHGDLALDVRHESGGEVIEGHLTCCTCDASYPIRAGIPRFVSSGSYASSFGRQWHWFRTVQLDSHTGTTETADTFHATTGWRPADLAGRLVLDAGVGAGRFAECAADWGAHVFGVDLTEAVDAAFATVGTRPNVHLAQADIFALPFRLGTFARAYAIGVLHHTPDPERAFGCVASAVTDGGELAVYLYARYGWGHHASDLIRRLTTRLPPRVALVLCSAAVPLHFFYKIPGLGRAFRLFLPISPAENWRWRWLDTFDWYSPKYQFKFLYPEVFRWFRTHSFHDVEIFDGPIRMRGVKQAIERHETRPHARLVAS
jgi:SAM-dependent methyltransferase